MAYDPVQRHRAVEGMVVDDSAAEPLRRYYRFRVDRWYGGIVTGDCAGCGLVCAFCWVRDPVMTNPQKVGHWCDADEVSDRLLSLSRRKNVRQVRVSGGEPTVGRAHLLRLLDNLRDARCRFILETNGILIGHDKSYASELASYPFVHVRVSLKGCSEAEFSLLTNAEPHGFGLQTDALRNLVEAGVSCHPSVMAAFSPPASLKGLRDMLATIRPSIANDLEIEELILYPHVEGRLRRCRLWPSSTVPGTADRL